MSSALDITRSVRPPRAAYLDFPLGHTTGKPGEPALQRDILVDALGALSSLAEPGGVKMLPFSWSDDESWKESVMAGGDERVARYDTPQYQSEDDRLRAESCDVCRT